MAKTRTTYRYLAPELADRLRGLAFTARRPMEGPLQGPHRSPNYGASVEFAEYRAYVPGDPVNLIDWAVYGRTDRHMIRRYQEETNLRSVVLLDRSESMAFQSAGPRTKFDFAATLAASIAYVFVSQGDCADVWSFDSEIADSPVAALSMEGLSAHLSHLEAIVPQGKSDIEEAINSAAERLKRRSFVIIISDFLSEPESIIRALRRLRHDKHEILLYHVLDRDELAINFNGLAELRELETSERLVVDPDQWREAYRQEVERYLDELRKGCGECSAEHILVDTHMPIIEAVSLRAKRS